MFRQRKNVERNTIPRLSTSAGKRQSQLLQGSAEKTYKENRYADQNRNITYILG